MSLRTEFQNESRLTLGLGIPLVGAQLAQVSMSFVDTVMAGNYHPDDLASVAIGSSFFMPLFTIAVGILMALSPIIAQLFGSRRLGLIGKKVRQGLWLSLFLSVPAILVLNNLGPVMNLLGFTPEVISITSGYLFALSWGIPAIFAFMVLRFFNEALGATRPALYVTLIGLAFNILGNYTLIYGRFGFPELGAVGTGWATALVFWVMFLVMLSYTAGRKTFRRFQLFRQIRLPERRHIGEILRIGTPIGISMGMETSMFAMVALLMGSLGTTIVAAHQVAINIASVTFMIPLGLSMAITVRVGQLRGRNQPAKARFAGFTGIILCTLIMSLAALIMISFPKQIVGIYTGDPEVIEMASMLLIMAAVFQISDGLQVGGSGALRGLKDTRVPMIVNLAAYWGIGIPLGYFLGMILDWGPRGLWMGLIAGLTVAAILHNIRFHRITRRMTS
ncbi:MATE family efflux transporter [Balneolales bacterium ANBcel1]|nr:MATE family efflux transporter [Balneolales bacterium ANBcel1]